VVVAELVPAVVAWNRGPLADLAGGPLEDRRVAVCETDVARVLQAATGGFDAILLDVDNGPDGLTRRDNTRLYAAAGLAAAYNALRPAGVLGVWSIAPDPAFARRLRQAGFAVEEVRVRARGGRRGGRHTVWIAVRGA
jgi:spermidine synthase